jgi:hypothetical protein
MAIIPKMSKEQQFSVGSDEITQGMEGILSNNSDALIHLAKKSDRLVVYGLQDETGNYIDGLGERRARNVAKELNKLMWNEEISLKITTQEYPLKNFVKSGILREHQQLLNQRGVAIVAHFDQNTQTDTSGIWFLPPSLRPLPWQL